jgi:hypothetical protein
MLARRVTELESYLGLFRTPERDDGPRHAAVARIGKFEVRMVEMPSVNASEDMSLWVELYDRDLQLGVDSRKCSDFDEAVDVAHFLIAQARVLWQKPQD